MNYASTSPRQSVGLTQALIHYLEQNQHLNVGRNVEGLEDGRIQFRARNALARFLGAPGTSQVIFTSGITLSLNMVLLGLLKPGDHVLTTHVEHHAVSRPLRRLQRQGVIDVDLLPCAADGSFDPAVIGKHVRSNTRLLVMTHGSNVLGTILPVAESCAQAKACGLFTVVDTAQTAGSLAITLDAHTDVLAFTGHKGLRALQGIGGFVLSTEAAQQLEPWITGGTGSASGSFEQPQFLPDKFESGTPNTLGILSLAVAVEELLAQDLSRIREQEVQVTARFLEGAKQIKGLKVHGTGKADLSAPVVSVSSPTHDSGVLARRLYEEYGILTRCGLHCAPLAHQCAGTFPAGTLRLSFGPETSCQDIDRALYALETLLRS
jgi:cysteine desulfurase family protein